MRVWLSVAIGTALLGLATLPAPVLAQQKTVKACQEEWRANKAENQAKGITEKAYVAQCRAGGSAAQPASTPGAKPAPSPSAATSAAQKTVKACREEWRANKAAYQAAKVTEKAYVDKCRAGETAALHFSWCQPVRSHVLAQRRRDQHAAIRLLVVFDNRHPSTAHGQAAAI